VTQQPSGYSQEAKHLLMWQILLVVVWCNAGMFQLAPMVALAPHLILRS